MVCRVSVFARRKFTGWSNYGVIPVGTANALTFEATFEPKKPSGLMFLFR